MSSLVLPTNMDASIKEESKMKNDIHEKCLSYIGIKLRNILATEIQELETVETFTA